MRVMPGGALEAAEAAGEGQIFCGRKLQEHRGAFILEHAMEHGMVQGWDAMEILWEVCAVLLNMGIVNMRF